jgi:hypothetical protein
VLGGQFGQLLGAGGGLWVSPSLLRSPASHASMIRVSSALRLMPAT